MGFFNRRTRPANANTATAVGDNSGTNNEKRAPATKITSRRDRRQDAQSGSAPGNGTINSKPSFGQWIKVTWPDILTMVVMGAICLGVYKAPPAPSRSFPVYFPSGSVVYPQFAYPLRKEIIPSWGAALLATLIPIAVFLLMQIRIRSFWDVNNAVIGLLYSVVTAAVFQVFLKWLIGGLRPHFLDVCKPNVPPFGGQAGNGFGKIMYDRKICTGDEKQINDSLESFPSGHSTAAFAGFVFLYLYLNAKLKLWSNYHPAYWKLIVTYMPVLGAVLIGGALTIDEFHNWYDVLAGAIIGTVMALSAYRMVYAAVWDFRFNHMPLMRNLPFTYGNGPTAFDGFHDALWTRQVGWGTPEGGAWGGAPYDAAGTNSAGGVQGHVNHASGGEGVLGGDSSDGYNGRSSTFRNPVGRGEQMV